MLAVYTQGWLSDLGSMQLGSLRVALPPQGPTASSARPASKLDCVAHHSFSRCSCPAAPVLQGTVPHRCCSPSLLCIIMADTHSQALSGADQSKASPYRNSPSLMLVMSLLYGHAARFFSAAG